MKKSAITLIALLLCSCLLFTACTAPSTQQKLTGYDTEQVTSIEYKKKQLEFGGSFGPETYSVDEGNITVYNDGWSSVRNDSLGAYIQSKSVSADPFMSPVVAEVELGELEPGYYNITFNMSMSKGSKSYEPLMDLRAFTTEVGTKEVNYYKQNSQSEDNKSVEVATESHNVLGYRALCANDATGGFTEYGLDFTVYEKKAVTVWVASYAGYSKNVTIRVREATLKSITPSEFSEVFDLRSYFTDELENDIEYRDDTLYVFDMYSYIENITDSSTAYDILTLVSTIQGIVNRDNQQRLYMYLTQLGEGAAAYSDWFWLDYLTREGQFMEGKRIEMISSPGTLIRLFRDKLKGLVVWDEKVPATSNVAITVCGVEDLIPVRFNAQANSLMSILIEDYEFEIKHTLVNKFTGEKGSIIWDTETFSTGSAKNDAYIWAMEKYLETGLCSNEIMGNILDAYTYDQNQVCSVYYNLFVEMTTNKDLLVQNKAFIFDLFCMDNKIPNDDPYQDLGTDYSTAVKILYTQNQRHESGDASRIVGFPPWWIKYTRKADHSKVPDEAGDLKNPNAEVPVEWGTSKLYGYFNIVKDADAYGSTGLCNASILSQTPTIEYVQSGQYSVGNIDPEYADITSKEDIPVHNYAIVYMGDYDGGAWVNKFLPTFFNDPKLNEYPLCWPVATGLMQRVPNAYNFIYSKAGDNTYFVGSDNGYGYLNAEFMLSRNDLLITENGGYLTQEQVNSLKGSVESYVAQSLRWYEKADIDIMGFYISQWNMDVDKGFIDKISKMTPAGFAYTPGGGGGTNAVIDGIPCLRMSSGYEEYKPNKDTSVPTFSGLRMVLKSPTFAANYIEQQERNNNVKILDPYTFYYLFSLYYGA